MSELVVTDTSCLIALERIARLDLLPGLFDGVLAPPAVVKEFGQLPSWLQNTPVEDSNLAAALGLTLGPGESEAIAIALHRNYRVILDDLQARQTDVRLGVRVIGTLGILLRGKREGLVSEVKPLLDALDAAGFRVDTPLRRRALELAGEVT